MSRDTFNAQPQQNYVPDGYQQSSYYNNNQQQDNSSADDYSKNNESTIYKSIGLDEREKR